MPHMARTLSCVAFLLWTPTALASWWVGMPDFREDTEILSAEATLSTLTLQPCSGPPQTFTPGTSGDLVDGVWLDTPAGCWLSATLSLEGPVVLTLLKDGDVDVEEANPGALTIPMAAPGAHGAGLWLKPDVVAPAELPSASDAMGALAAALAFFG